MEERNGQMIQGNTEGPTEASGRLSRRSLLAYIGVAGAAAVTSGWPAARTAFGQSPPVTDYSNPMSGSSEMTLACSSICVTTIAELRVLTAPDPDIVYYVKDTGQEGHFTFDAADTVSADNMGTILVSTSGDRFKRSFVAGVVHVKWFGAKGDGTTDDTASIQAAMDSIPHGGTVFFAEGTYRTTSRLIVRCSNITLSGNGNRNIQTPITLFDSKVPATLLADHTGDCVWLSHTNPINGFKASGLTFATGGSGRLKAKRCFGFDLGGSGQFSRDILCEKISVQGFETAFDLYASSASSGSEASMGVIRIIQSSTMHNNWIAKTSFGHWNSFIYELNEGGQNGYSEPGQGGIHIEGHNVSICHNVLEGQRDPIKVSNSYRGLVIKNNYFEANVGNACIEVWGSRGPFDIGENFYYGTMTSHRVYLFATAPGRCSDPYWPQHTNKMDFTTGMVMSERLLNNSVSITYSRSDCLQPAFIDPPAYQSVSATVSYNHASRTPVHETGLLSRTGVTSGTGIVTDLRNIQIDAGKWVVVCWTLKQNSTPAEPYLNIRLNDNGMSAQQIEDFNVYGYGDAFRNGQWATITAAIKAGQSASNAMLYYYPFGISPASGLEFEYFSPVVYTVDDVNDIRPYFPLQTYRTLTSAPEYGVWRTGEQILNRSPAGGGYVGWVCTEGGKAHTASIGTLTLGSNQITGLTNISAWMVGDEIKGQGIPAAAKITAVNPGLGALSIDAAATASGSISLFDAMFKPFGGVTN